MRAIIEEEKEKLFFGERASSRICMCVQS